MSGAATLTTDLPSGFPTAPLFLSGKNRVERELRLTTLSEWEEGTSGLIRNAMVMDLGVLIYYDIIAQIGRAQQPLVTFPKGESWREKLTPILCIVMLIKRLHIQANNKHITDGRFLRSLKDHVI